MGNERLVLLGGADQTCLCLAIMNATLGPSRSSTAAWVQGQFELKHVPLQSAHPPSHSLPTATLVFTNIAAHLRGKTPARAPHT